MKEYALYKGEALLCVGTAREIAQDQGVSVDTIRYYGTPAYKRRRRGPGANKNRRALVPLEEDDE